LNYLLDTHLLVWAALGSDKLSAAARRSIADKGNRLFFSAASLWETAIKNALRRPDFPVDAGQLRAGLLASGYGEIPVEGRHVVSFRELPSIHRDPFDRLLISQAKAEGLLFLTADRLLAEYGHPVRYVG
jgi:PIN domain nuclease of toxin-antitoxin system